MNNFSLIKEVERDLKESKENYKAYKNDKHESLMLVEHGKIKALEKVEKYLEYLQS